MIIRTTAAIAFVLLAAAPAEPQTRYDAEAIRLNNRGVALMGQQFTERAAESFAAACKKDPKLAQAAINEGIALMAQQKLDEAKKALQAALALQPGNAQACAERHRYRRRARGTRDRNGSAGSTRRGE